MAAKAAKEAAKKKAAKQKKLLAVLVLGLVVALVFAFTSMSHGGSAPVQAEPAAATTPVGADSTSAPPAPPVTAGVADTPVTAVHAFTGLGRKDPFYDGGPNAAGAPSSGSPKSPTNPPIHDAKPTTKPKTPVSYARAVISVNGKDLNVARGAKFGHAPVSGAPLFRLLKVSATRAVIAVVGTPLQYTLNLGLPLTLSQTGGNVKYTLVLVHTKTATKQ